MRKRNFYSEQNQQAAEEFVEDALEAVEDLADMFLSEKSGDEGEPKESVEDHDRAGYAKDVVWCFGSDDDREEAEEKESGFRVEDVCEEADFDGLKSADVSFLFLIVNFNFGMF